MSTRAPHRSAVRERRLCAIVGGTMISLDQPGDDSAPFSPELTRDVAAALHAYLLSYGTEGDEALRQLTNRVCREAHALGLPPEKMLIALKYLFERTPLPDVRHSERRLRAFEKFISGCIKSYFDFDAANDRSGEST